MSERILIVDDDPVQRRLLDNMVRKLGYEPLVADSGDAAVAMLNGEAAHVDAMVLDLVMPGLDGLGVLSQLRKAGLAIPIIVQTAHGGIDNVVTAMRAGATDFVVKPIGAERLQVSLRNALAASALEDELARIKRSRTGTLGFKDIIACSPRMQAVLRIAQKAARSSIPVLIEGQSGVGKELVARAIHGSGARRTRAFVAVNCGAIPDNLVESVLFGHEKGAFTGATDRHVGKFAEASGGTLFLDEVGELPAAAQVKLLRAVQENEIEPVGGRKSIKVDVRLISATNRDLIADVKVGRFREDLFYRLHVFPVAVPPLRERIDDIAELARHFLARFAAEEGKRRCRLSAEALSLLRSYHWPGNVRQLENAIFRAVVLAETDMIGIDEFPQIAARRASAEAAATPVCPEPISEQREAMGAAPLAGHASPIEAFAAVPIGALDLLDSNGDVRPLEEIEGDTIRFAISHYRGQMSEVARRLRIGRSTLYRKLDALGLAADSADLDVPAL